jgi:RNA-binding protein YlmH
MKDAFSHLGLDDREKIFAARCTELARLAWERQIPRYTPFLDEREQTIAACAGAAERCCCRSWGGTEDATRAIYGFAYEEDALDVENFPIRPVCIRWRHGYSISHRDILGTLMSLQIKRETLGDILVGEGEAVVFAAPAIAALILSDVSKIGGVGVTVTEELPERLPEVRRERRSGIAASMRLDCITAMLTGKSRSEVSRMIRAGQVSRGGQVVTDPAREIASGEHISIRGVGKFRLCDVEGETRSGRHHVAYEKYI